MPYTVIIHIPNTDSVIGEVDEIPSPSDTLLVISNPRTKDGKELTFISEDTAKVVWPLANLNFIEVLASKDQEDIFGFVRE